LLSAAAAISVATAGFDRKIEWLPRASGGGSLMSDSTDSPASGANAQM
jgi:hypothetical protein